MTRKPAPQTRAAARPIDLPAAPADQQALIEAGGVACWSEEVVIDTYAAGAPDPYPLFLDRRVYQGSSGRVYPMPMIDSIAHEKSPRVWQAIHLENSFVRLMLLPELGGRIHIGYDKSAGYDFFYRNNVIKPALVGLAGPWVSGGVEFNWPQHHRPGTYLPVDSRIERESDGGVVVWHSDLDPLQRMRGTHGIRLRPGSTLIEAEVVLHNRTDVPQTFLWWANAAARSHEQYQSFFPDDVAFVADHARRAITAFPRADRSYYGVDYPALGQSRAGADRLDVYSNIPVPTSYMVTDTAHDFFGGYDHAADAGFVHWADRAISPGKKQWTWGDGEIGRAWDAQLTDGDGPYVELMAGVYTDNQPDFSWLEPGETKRFSQFWYPIHGVGPARQATRDAALAVSRDGSRIRVGVLSTRALAAVTITVTIDRTIAASWDAALSPDSALVREVMGADGSLRVEVHDRTPGAGILVSWSEHVGEPVIPWQATAPEAPAGIASNDELYLTAEHLTQYRHPSRSPVPYLEEALRRDQGDSRAATARAAQHLQHARYDDADRLLEKATARLTRRNLQPRDGEVSYLHGLVKERLGMWAGADEKFAKAAWSAQWVAPASLARARIALRTGRALDAITHARAAGDIAEARRIVVLALHQSGRVDEARDELAALRQAEPLDVAALLLHTPAAVAEAGTDASLTHDPRAPLDVASEFARAGAWQAALDATATRHPQALAGTAFGNPEPLRHYLRATWFDAIGDHAQAAAAERAAAQTVPAEYAFPAGLDQHDALVAALSAAHDAGGTDARAHGLLGMWMLNANRADEALTHLRLAVESGSDEPVVWRNLALATVQSGGDPALADAAFVHALGLRRDARLVFERDLLAQVRGLSSAHRLALLGDYADLLESRDDLALLHVTLLLDAGQTGSDHADAQNIDTAWQILITRTFRPFEGGEGRVIAAFDRASCARAREVLTRDPAAAARMLEDGIVAPPNLGEGRHPAVSQAERWVLMGDARQTAGDPDGAMDAWRAACERGPLATEKAIVQQSDFWIGVAHLRLNHRDRAEQVWRSLDERAAERERGTDDVDYFATSLPELLLFDTDTAASRAVEARHLRRAAEQGRAMAAAGVTR